MTQELPRAGNLSGCFLLAHPLLFQDPNFRRTIVYLAHHSPEMGAQGFILNRPLQKRVQDLSDTSLPSPLKETRVYQGGPVEQDKLFIEHLEWDEDGSQLRFKHHDIESIPKEGEGCREVSDMIRGFLGYAGWSQGQLEEEIARQSWVICPPDKSLIHANNTSATWKMWMRKHDPLLHLLSKIPNHPRDN